MRNHCKDGDLTIIVREEPGLEENIGRFLWVDGLPLLDAELGIVFLTRPAGGGAMAVLCRDGSIKYNTERRYHPDAWMVPVWRPSPKRAKALRAPLRNLPKVSRGLLEKFMNGEVSP